MLLTARAYNEYYVNVCGKRNLLQQHRVMERDVVGRAVRRDGTGPLARRSRVEIGRAQAERIWRYLRRPRRTPLNRAASGHNSACLQ
jgi:hypothetical protein